MIGVRETVAGGRENVHTISKALLLLGSWPKEPERWVVAGDKGEDAFAPTLVAVLPGNVCISLASCSSSFAT